MEYKACHIVCFLCRGQSIRELCCLVKYPGFLHLHRYNGDLDLDLCILIYKKSTLNCTFFSMDCA